MRCLARSFEPDLNLVAIRIGDVSVGKTGSELTTTQQAPSGVFDLGDGTVDVSGLHQTKAEMRDAAAETSPGWVLAEREDVVPARSLGVDQSISTPVLTQSKDLLVEPQRASQVPDGEINVRQAVSVNHNYLEILSRSNHRRERRGPRTSESKQDAPSRVGSRPIVVRCSTHLPRAPNKYPAQSLRNCGFEVIVAQNSGVMVKTRELGEKEKQINLMTQNSEN